MAINKDVVLNDDYRARIKSMHDEKVKNNKLKLEAYGGYYNTDDHGFIYFPDFKFEPVYKEGLEYTDGQLDVAKNLRKFISEIPAYCYKDSALAGTWVGNIPRFAKIRFPYDEVVPEDLKAIHEKYHFKGGIGGTNHMGPDMNIGLQIGYKGILDKIRYYKEFNYPAGKEFYEAEEDTMLGIMAYIENNLTLVKKLYEEEDESSWRKENYRKIAEALENLLTKPPMNFREVCQFIAIFQSVDRSYFLGGALGQLDELLRPYFEKDIREGILTEEEAVWIVASLFYNDTHYSQLGGRSPDGKRSLSTRVSYIVLQAAHELHIPYNLAIRVYEGQDDALMEKALEYILEKGSGPAFSLSKGIEEGYMKQGHTKELARMRAKVGCNWVALPGIEYPLQDVTRLNLAWAFVYALDDVMASAEEPDLESLWQRYCFHANIMIDAIKVGYDYHLDYISEYRPELVLNFILPRPH